jgi:hypothetical protein
MDYTKPRTIEMMEKELQAPIEFFEKLLKP